MKRNRLQILLYIVVDFLASAGMWLVFVPISQRILSNGGQFKPVYITAALVIGLYWVGIYALAGLYQKPFRKSRLQELGQVFKYTLLGVLVIFFLIVLDDPVLPEYASLRNTFTTYLGLQFGAVALLRLIITTRTQMRIRKGKIGFPTLLVGCQGQALKIYRELGKRKRSLGYQFRGYVCTASGSAVPDELATQLPRLGELAQLPQLVQQYQIEEIIIALEGDESRQIPQIIQLCEDTPANIKLVPGMYDYIVGSAKVYHILGTPLIEVFPQMMHTWERILKRLLDIVGAFVALVVLFPLFVIIAIWIKLDSKGPVFYLQERIGKGGKPFFIFKFRSMYVDAERHGPALTSDADPRITRVGHFLRKIRLDELPQFWNVLKGDMSLVGPRPERAYFIEQIVKVAPEYRHLHKVRPGITSWGQVKYGYASNVEEMVERLQYDLLYLEQMSLGLDIKILLYTLIVIIEGRGK